MCYWHYKFLKPLLWCQVLYSSIFLVYHPSAVLAKTIILMCCNCNGIDFYCCASLWLQEIGNPGIVSYAVSEPRRKEQWNAFAYYFEVNDAAFLSKLNDVANSTITRQPNLPRKYCHCNYFWHVTSRSLFTRKQRKKIGKLCSALMTDSVVNFTPCINHHLLLLFSFRRCFPLDSHYRAV